MSEAPRRAGAARVPRRLLAAAAVLLALGPAPAPALARAQVGRKVPWFKLQRLDGAAFYNRHAQGRVTVFVVGRTRKAAPPCKRWVLQLIERQGQALPVYQVIVVAKPWFLPRSVALRQIEKIVPRGMRHRVLLEWGEVFAEVYGIPKHDDPVVLVMGADGTLHLRYRGPATPATLARVQRVLQRLGVAAGPPRRPPPPRPGK